MFDLETFDRKRVVPFCSWIQELGKSSGEYNRKTTEKEYQKRLIDCFAFKGTNCKKEMLDDVLEFKGEPKRSILNLLNIIYTW